MMMMDEPAYVAAPKAGDHMLSNKFCFWFMQRDALNRANTMAAQEYERSIKQIGEFQSVEGFWQIYNHLKKPNDITTTTELHMFKGGIKPVWEDQANCNGGKLLIRVPKGLASRMWEQVLLAIIGDQFDNKDEVCGAVVSLRANEDIIAIWNRTGDNIMVVQQLRENLKTILELPNFARTEYKKHNKRIQRATHRGSHHGGPPAMHHHGHGGTQAPPAWA